VASPRTLTTALMRPDLSRVSRPLTLAALSRLDRADRELSRRVQRARLGVPHSPGSSDVVIDGVRRDDGQNGMTTAVPWRAADVFFTFVMWAVMMVGMMAGPAAPTLFLLAAACAGRGAMTASSPYLGGAILIGSSGYQMTPWKGACLTHCRSPLGFLMTNWRDGRLGSLRMGVGNGIYCVGCCWALMCVLFVVGVMNLFWVAALTGFVLVEKFGPAGTMVARVAGAAMAFVGIFVIAAKV
jgi:predicted metal-binding membrane protein